MPVPRRPTSSRLSNLVRCQCPAWCARRRSHTLPLPEVWRVVRCGQRDQRCSDHGRNLDNTWLALLTIELISGLIVSSFDLATAMVRFSNNECRVGGRTRSRLSLLEQARKIFRCFDLAPGRPDHPGLGEFVNQRRAGGLLSVLRKRKLNQTRICRLDAVHSSARCDLAGHGGRIRDNGSSWRLTWHGRRSARI